MKERPILFSGPMVRAILEGRKTQTRRVVKPQPAPGQGMVNASYCGDPHLWLREGPCNKSDPAFVWRCPYGKPGDRLWVRETFAEGIHQMADVNHWAYAADHFGAQQRLGDRWKPSIHMPRKACRILLEITCVRVEQLNHCSVTDAEAEGFKAFPGCKVRSFAEADAGIPYRDHSAVDAFRALWADLNGDDSLNTNPWVWVVEFKRVEV